MSDASADVRMIFAAEAALGRIIDYMLDERGIADDHLRRSLKAIIFMRGYARSWPAHIAASAIENHAVIDIQRAIESLKLEAAPRCRQRHRP